MSYEVSIINSNELQSKIFTIRGLQVMMDRDLAELYQVEIRVLNQAVKRNIEHFPEHFRFQLEAEEFELLRSQNVTLEKGRGKHRKYLPYVFTEQGVSMLSAVLRSETAIKVSIQIMDAFVGMRKFIANNAAIFQRLDSIEQNQYLTDTKLDKVFEAIEAKDIKPEQGIFFDGQVFDAYVFNREARHD
jgi:phage regulator Rha-like protein